MTSAVCRCLRPRWLRLRVWPRTWRSAWRSSVMAGFSASTSLGRLVLAQPLERRLPHLAVAGPAGEFDLGDQFRLQPVHVAGLLRRVLAAERALVGAAAFSAGMMRCDLVLPEAGADPADIGEMIAAMDADQQRAEFAVGGFPAADHDLVAGAAFGLGPALGAAGAIGRVELLGDDAFERQLAGRLQDGVAAGLEMLDIADQLALALARLQQFLQPLLALGERQRAQDPRHRRTADRRRRRSDRRSCRRTAPPAARENPARRCDRARRSRRR